MSNGQNKSYLSACFLCRHSQPEWRQLIALQKQTMTFKRGQSLFSEGDPTTGIFFILSGAVKMHKQWGGEKKEFIVRFAGDGDIVGVRGLGSSIAYPISATALGSTRACFIPIGFLEASLR